MRATPFDLQLACVKSVFGERWLSDSPPGMAGTPNHKNSAPEKQTHQLQAAWKDLQKELGAAFSGNANLILPPIDLRHSAALTLVLRVASAVFRLPDVSGFQDLILPRLLRPSEFDGALHECEVASWFAKYGLQVEFVPTECQSGKRSPDLRVHAQGRAIEVECKLKEPITAIQMTPSTWGWLCQQCLCLLEKLNLDIEINGLVIGPADEDTFTRAIARIESLALTGFRGGRVLADIPMFVAIADSPIIIPHYTTPEYEAWAASRGCAVSSCRHWPLGNGTYRFSNHKGMGIGALDGHTFNQVDRSIYSASGQFLPGKLGIAVINVSLAGVSQLNILQNTYLEILADALSHRTWGGGRHTRIGAIVLKLSHITKERVAGRCTYNASVGIYLPVIQPGLERPDSLIPSNIIKCLLAAPVLPMSDELGVNSRPEAM
jgi:hypothetical protein